MLILLPSAAFITLFLILLGSDKSKTIRRDWRWSFLGSMVLWGALVVLVTEILSISGQIHKIGLALSWSTVLGGSLVYGIASGSFSRARAQVSYLLENIAGKPLIGLVGLFLLVTLLLTVAWVSPVNNNDSLLYHMSRVAHWAQNGSLEHYPTVYEHQLFKPPWSEMAMLNLQALWGNDQPVKLVQWWSMITCLIGVSAIARMLGAGRRGQLLAAAIAFSVPMGVLQSTSTQNDYAAALWFVITSYFVVLQERRKLSLFEIGLFSLSVGIGLLTKGTYIVLVPPLLLWFSYRFLRREGILRSVGFGLAAIFLISLVNFGFWQRNIQTYGGPFGRWSYIQGNFSINLLRGLDNGEEGEEMAINSESIDDVNGGLDEPGPKPNRIKTMSASIVKNIAQNMGTPINKVNEIMSNGLDFILVSLGEELEQPLINEYWNHEDLAGSLLQLLLVPISIAILLFFRERFNFSLVLSYAIMLIGAYVFLAVGVGHSDSLYGVRYQLPFIIAWSSLSGVTLEKVTSTKIMIPLSMMFLVFSIPWILFNQTRPVIARKPWVTRISSVFTSTEAEVAFANWQGVMDEYIAIANLVNANSCYRIGLRINSSDPEYLFWWMLNAPRDDIQLEVINTYEHLVRYSDPDFSPCNIVCTVCPPDTDIEGYSISADFGSIQLYELK